MASCRFRRRGQSAESGGKNTFVGLMAALLEFLADDWLAGQLTDSMIAAAGHDTFPVEELTLKVLERLHQAAEEMDS